MDVGFELVTSTGWAIMFFLLLLLTITCYVGGFVNLDISLHESQKEEYRRSIVLENTLSLEASSTQDLGYSYNFRRSVIPVEYFTRKASGSNSAGYAERNGHCYIPGVPALDGEDLGVAVAPLYPVGQGPGGSSMNSDSYRELNCLARNTRFTSSSFAPVLLVRKAKDNEPLPARLYVYEIQ